MTGIMETMKRLFTTTAVLVVLMSVFMPLPLFAQQTNLTDDHIDRIKSNCQTALGTLARIHANDAPMYINRNQIYFSISDKLMAHLNGRLALNRYDATQLVRIASDFNDALVNFRAAYREYDNSMAQLTRMDCRKQPIGFYQQVAETRALRQKVNDATQQLSTYIAKYRTGVSSFQSENTALLKGVR